MALLAPLFNPPFLAPPASYSLIKARVEMLIITNKVHPLSEWMSRCLKTAFLGVTSLGTLDLQYHIMGGQRHLWRDLLPANPPALPQAPTYIMQADTSSAQVMAAVNKEVSLV